MISACQAVRKLNPEKLIVAVPVAPPDTVDRLLEVADEVFCTSVVADFNSVSQFYESFLPVSDQQVKAVLERC